MKRCFFTFLTLLAVGICAGFLNGLLGAGGGIVIVFGLNRLLGSNLEDKRSVYATAIAVILPLSVLTAIQYFRRGSLELNAFAPLILPAVAGGVLGGLLLRRLSPRFLSRLFAAVVLISGIVLVV